MPLTGHPRSCAATQTDAVLGLLTMLLGLKANTGHDKSQGASLRFFLKHIQANSLPLRLS